MRKKYVFKESETAIRACLYQRSTCNLALGSDCLVAKKVRASSDFLSIKKTVAAAELCEKRGDDLTRCQYNAKKLGVMV